MTATAETTLERGIRILNADTRCAAGSRCIIKRALRANSLPVGEPSEYVGWFIAHPWACTRNIERHIESAVNHWTTGNNSGDCRILNRENAAYARMTHDVELLMSVLGVTLDYPGLYPTYEWLELCSHHGLFAIRFIQAPAFRACFMEAHREPRL